MHCPQTLIVGLDAFEPTPDVFGEAKLLARTFGARIVLVHAIPEAAPMSPGFDILQDQVSDAFDLLREAAVAEGLEVEANHIIRYGSPEDVLLDVQKGMEASWIVIGARRRSLIDRILLGSTAEGLLQNADCPVWVVRPTESPVGPDLQRILVAVDESPAAREALEGALRLARTFVAPVDVLSVGEPEDTEGFQERLRAEIDDHGVDLNFRSRQGPVLESLLAELSEHPADLLVLGHAGRRGLLRLIRGNTADALSRSSPCSLLCLHA